MPGRFFVLCLVLMQVGRSFRIRKRKGFIKTHEAGGINENGVVNSADEYFNMPPSIVEIGQLLRGSEDANDVYDLLVRHKVFKGPPQVVRVWLENWAKQNKLEQNITELQQNLQLFISEMDELREKRATEKKLAEKKHHAEKATMLASEEPQDQPATQAEAKFDAFLSHDWGTKGNHKLVVQIAEGLKQKGIKVWIDAEQMDGNISIAMTKGIDESTMFVVFVTANYLKKVNNEDENNNCRREFNYAKGRKKKMVAVIMERGMGDTSKWVGPVGAELMGDLYPANFVTGGTFQEEIGNLATSIRKKVQKVRLKQQAQVS